MSALTAHCIVKNEENFIWYAVKSVVDFVDQVIVFDTGSEDKTVEIVQNLVKDYPDKIVFEEKGECDKKRHTHLRQEMIDRTTTGWFMILDGDEVWTMRGMKEAVRIIKEDRVNSIESFFYECVGDIFHTHYKSSFKTIRFAKSNIAEWRNEYGLDTLISKKSNEIITQSGSELLKNKFWHLTHLPRSVCGGEDFSSGGKRSKKIIKTYFIIGKKIQEVVPEVFNGGAGLSMSFFKSFFYFILFFLKKY